MRKKSGSVIQEEHHGSATLDQHLTFISVSTAISSRWSVSLSDQFSIIFNVETVCAARKKLNFNAGK
jgi:hypothetical protein